MEMKEERDKQRRVWRPTLEDVERISQGLAAKNVSPYLSIIWLSVACEIGH